MSHYWTADDEPELRAKQFEDWLEDLGEFPASDVAAACTAWRQGESYRKRPLPGDIRLLAIAEGRRRAPGPRAAPRLTDMAGEAIPAPEIVRAGWRAIRFPLLTAAERALFVAETTATTLAAAATLSPPIAAAVKSFAEMPAYVYGAADTPPHRPAPEPAREGDAP